MTARAFSAIGVALAIATAVSCGSDSSSSAPSTSLNINGSWTGTWTYNSAAGLTITEAVTATVTPYVAQYSLNWQAPSGASGGLLLSGEASFAAGNASIAESAVGLACTGNGTANGMATSNTITFDIASFTGSGCQWSTNNHFALHR